MSTKLQKDANRKNAKKSTGPKTKEGKEESSKNATTHGFFAQQDVIKYESQVDYDMLRQELIEDLNPIGPMQYLLADRIVSLSWRLERVVRMQNQTIDVRLKRQGSNPDLALGRMANEDFVNYRVLDKLIMYERRMENSLYKTIKQLKNLQKEKAKNKANYQANRRPPEIGPFYSSNQQYNHRDPEPINQNIRNEPNSQDKSNLTPEITGDYEHALLHGYPPDKPYPPQPKQIKSNNTTNDIIAKRNQGRSEAHNHPRRRSILRRSG